MQRELRYSKYISLWVTEDTFSKLKILAQKKYPMKTTNIVGEKLKQPKSRISTIVREIIEKSL